MSLSLSLVLAAGCVQSSDRKLIGTWETGSMDAVCHITFKPDHTLTFAFLDMNSGKFQPEIPGTWQLKGAQLTTDFDFASIPDMKPTRKKMTETVTFIGTDKIERKGGYPYERVK